MEAFGLLHFLQALLPQDPAQSAKTSPTQPSQESKKQETERVSQTQAEQKTDSQNAYLLFMAQHESRAKRTKAKP